MVNTPLTTQIEEIKLNDCGSSIGFIRDIVEIVLLDASNRLTLEAETAATESAAEKSGGLFGTLMEAVTDGATAAFGSAFDGDIRSVSDATALFGNISGALLNPGGLIPSVTPITLGGGKLPMPTGSITFAGGTPLIQQAINNQLKKSDGGATDCNNSVLIGTLNTVGDTLKGLASNTTKAVGAAHTVLAMATTQISGFTDALMALGAKAFEEALNDQTIVLEKMIDLIDKIQEDYADMDEEDFNLNHVEFIEVAKQFLIQADVRLEGVRVRLVDQGAGLDKDDYAAVKDLVDLVADTFCDVGAKEAFGLNFSIRPLRILTNVVLLEELNAVLAKSASSVEKLSGNVSSFVDSFEQDLKTDNLYAPIIGELQCRIKQIIADMGSTQSKNTSFSFFVKEKQWCIDLQVLAKLMSAADSLLAIKDPTPEFLETTLGLGLFGDSTYLVRDALMDDATQQQQSVDSTESIVEAVGLYIDLVKKGLTTPLPPKLITARGAVVESKMERRIDEAGSTLGILTDFVGATGTDFIQGVGAASQFLTYLNDQDLGSMANALVSGDVSSLFSLDGATGKLEALALRYVSAALSCISPGSEDDQKRKELEKVNKLMQENARSSALQSSLMAGASDAYVEEVLEAEVPRYSFNLDFDI
jgi:hypothetical protein